MSKFLDVLDIRHIDGKWVLDSAFRYSSDRLRKVVTVPCGFETDFASVPRIPLAFLFFGDTSHEAAVIHDWLYRTKEFSRSEADAVFREANEVAGAGFIRRWAMWAGVRLGGWAAWTR